MGDMVFTLTPGSTKFHDTGTNSAGLLGTVSLTSAQGRQKESQICNL